uniref:Cytochrome P450 315a1 n=1 Tax=Leptinotarsa decemlineata TaxID=7539 RepID=V5K5L7_LEPDE|nr:cytochrome P450 315a1 [Leptinotarsa decemlineata]
MLSRQVRPFFCKFRVRCASSSGALEFEDIPSPKRLPLIGTTLSLLAAGGAKNLHKYVDRRHKELGLIFKDNVGPVSCVFLADPEGMRHVFSKEGKYPVHIKPESWLLYNEKHGYTRGLFFMDGEEWLKFRRIMNSLLLKGSLSWLEESCDAAGEVLVKKLEGFKNIEVPNLEQEMYKWSMDVIVSVLVGKRTYASHQEELDVLVYELAGKVSKIFETTSKLQLISAKLAQKYQLGYWKRFENSVQEGLDSAYSIVNHITANYKDADGLMAKMLSENIKSDDLNRIIVDLILGAGDTTAYTMIWILYVLSKNPNVQKELRNQLLQNKKTPFLKNVVKETLRLYPVAPFITRFLPESVTLCNYRIPANTLVVMSIYTSGRNEKYFIEPELFQPNRWLRNNHEMNMALQQASLPFGIGSRSCIGRKIAEHQLHGTLAKIVDKFQVEMCNREEVHDILQMIIKPSQNMRFKFNRIQD